MLKYLNKKIKNKPASNINSNQQANAMTFNKNKNVSGILKKKKDIFSNEEVNMNAKKLRTSTQRKSMDNTGDPYILRDGNFNMSVCTKCHAISHNKRWRLDEDLFNELNSMKNTIKVLCPACRKIKDNFPGGIVKLKGDFLFEHKDEIINLIKNEERKAMGFNPLERLMKIIDNDNGIEITTTNEKLAQRIGKSLKKAYQGKVEYKWSHDTKFLRAEWERYI